MKIDETINELLIESTTSNIGEEVKLELNFPLEAIYFDGHFDGFPILPGIVQLYLVKKFITKYFGVEFYLKKIANIKFLKPIFPGDKIHLLLRLTGKNKVHFEFQRNEMTCSKGGFDCEA